MTATLPNRISQHVPVPLAVPATPTDRRDAFADAITTAVAFFAARVRDADPDTAERAALVLLDLEKTRLRHGRKVSGTADDPRDFDAPLRDIAPLPEDRDPDDDEDFDDDEYEGEDAEYDDDDELDEDEEGEDEPEPIPAAKPLVAARGTVWTADEIRQFDALWEQYGAARKEHERRLGDGTAGGDIPVFDGGDPPPAAGRRGLTQAWQLGG